MRLLFRGASVHGVTITADEDGPLARINCIADVTKSVADHMGWDVLQFDGETLVDQGCSKIALNGMLAITSVKLVPNGMKQHTLEIPAGSIGSFVVVWKEDKDGNKSCELRFAVSTMANISPLWDYLATCGTVKAQLSANLTAAQMRLGESRTGHQGDESDQEDDGRVEKYTVPEDPSVPEWRTSDEIRAGIPRFSQPQKMHL